MQGPQDSPAEVSFTGGVAWLRPRKPALEVGLRQPRDREAVRRSLCRLPVLRLQHGLSLDYRSLEPVPFQVLTGSESLLARAAPSCQPVRVAGAPGTPTQGIQRRQTAFLPG